MPTVALAIPQHSETVTRTIVRQLAQELITRFGLPTDTRVLTEEQLGQVANPKGILDKKDSQPLSTDDYVRVGYREIYTDEGILQSAVYRPEYPELFIDPDVGIVLRPSYGIARLELTIEISLRDKSRMASLQRRLRLRGGLMHHVQQHDLHYQYEIPQGQCMYLYDAWALREANHGYGESLGDYFRRCFVSGGLTRRSNLDGTESVLAINESQAGVVGRFGEEVFYNEAAYEDGRHAMSMEYNLDYYQPLAVVLSYPLFVHNQRIPQQYVDQWQPVHRSEPDGSPTKSHIPGGDSKPLDRFYRADGGARLDPVDDWFPRNPQRHTVTEVITPLMVDESDPTLLLNLGDFGDEVLSPNIKSYIQAYPEESLEPYAAPYLVQAFRVHRGEEELTLHIESDGTLRTELPLNPRHRHYLRVAKLADLSKLSTNHVLDMLNAPQRTLKVFQNLDPEVTLDNNDGWLETAAGRYIRNDSFRRSVKRLPSTNRQFAQLMETNPRYTSRHDTVMRRRN